MARTLAGLGVVALWVVALVALSGREDATDVLRDHADKAAHYLYPAGVDDVGEGYEGREKFLEAKGKTDAVRPVRREGRTGTFLDHVVASTSKRSVMIEDDSDLAVANTSWRQDEERTVQECLTEWQNKNRVMGRDEVIDKRGTR